MFSENTSPDEKKVYFISFNTGCYPQLCNLFSISVFADSSFSILAFLQDGKLTRDIWQKKIAFGHQLRMNSWIHLVIVSLQLFMSGSTLSSV